jgi:hypothetical protein
MHAWPKTAVEIVNEIDGELNVQWDTDANICVLTGFIEQHCDPETFAAYVRAVALEDLRQIAEAAKEVTP